MTVRDLKELISRRLLLWSGLSVLSGLALLLFGNAFWRGFGIQALAWGAVDAAIAGWGLWRARRPPTGPPDRELVWLRRILLINAGLDVLYIAGGLALALTLGQDDPAWRGHGWGIVVQGVFLLLFDLLHARLRPAELPPVEWMNVQSPEHETFFWEAGPPAALLVHGFPDTPASLQPLGQVLHQAGWTVQGLLLPGFGPQIETLPERRWEEWLAAVREALRDLRRTHGPVLLVGYSLGGALSLGAAAEDAVDGLVLLAPFIWPRRWWQEALGKLLQPFVSPCFQPFRLANLADPRIRAGIGGLFPQADLDDPAALARIRRSAIPLALLEQIHLASLNGCERAFHVRAPVLIVQGSRDNVALPARTRLLLPRLWRARYVEVDADHEVLSPEVLAWTEVVRVVTEFAEKGMHPSGRAATQPQGDQGGSHESATQHAGPGVRSA